MSGKKFWAFLVVFSVWGFLFLLAAKLYFKKSGFFLPEWHVGDFVYFIIFIICFFLFHLGSLVRHQIFGKIVLTGFSFFFVPFFLALCPYDLDYAGSIVFSVSFPILLALIPDFIDYIKKNKEDKDWSLDVGELNVPYAAIGAVSSYMFWMPLANGALWLWNKEFALSLLLVFFEVVVVAACFIVMQKVISVFISLHRWIFTAPSK